MGPDDEATPWVGRRWATMPPWAQWTVAALLLVDAALWLLALAAPGGRPVTLEWWFVALATLAVALAAVVVVALTPRRR